ncbi:rRNA biogenesis protein RRP5 [Vitis vinifera]|uniref:rRNA biogenesis protein RRP5 n=1 Tax=Vitis vinifera TaxID=29760 RepID=A0A438JKY1_VITVI|nr:rRNA biogenesis protein RRP5 [Vitis vinifera]
MFQQAISFWKSAVVTSSVTGGEGPEGGHETKEGWRLDYLICCWLVFHMDILLFHENLLCSRTHLSIGLSLCWTCICFLIPVWAAFLYLITFSGKVLLTLIVTQIAKLQLSDSEHSELKWAEGFNIGTVIEGKIHDAKDFGVVISFEKYNDVFGFITHYQLTAERGSTVQAVVLDVAKTERLVDLSLKPEFLDRHKEDSSNSQAGKKILSLAFCMLVVFVLNMFNPLFQKRRREAYKELQPHQTVLSLPEYNYAIGYASVSDYNTQKFAQKQFLHGQSVIASVMALPSPSTVGRLLLVLKSVSEATETSSSKRAKKKSSYNVGSLVQAEVEIWNWFPWRVHITEVCDENVIENPFSNFRIGQTVSARIVAKANKSENNGKNHQWELSIKPEMLTGSIEVENKLVDAEFRISTGQRVTGYVYKVENEWIWLTISRHIKAQLFLLDTSCEPNELQEFQKRFEVGKAVSGYVLSANKEKKLLRMVLHQFSVSNGTLDGKVHFTELKDSWVSDPLSGYHEGQFVKCKVLEIGHSEKGTVHVDLSLWSSLNGMHSPNSRVEKIDNLHSDMLVQQLAGPALLGSLMGLLPGYVKNVTSKGCFILLSRKLDARILLANLSDGYVEKPEREFPIGKLVSGRVLSVEPLSRRVEVTLKTSSATSVQKSEVNDFSSILVGDIIFGTIKRVESYGLFITIDDTNMVGLCHISELSDDHISNIETKYKAGERVAAKILKVDEERHRISLGMKNSYIKETTQNNGFVDDTQLSTFLENNSREIQNLDVEYEDEEYPVLSQVESRASILPLEVDLDDVNHSNLDDAVGQNHIYTNETNTIDEKSKRRAKKKAKEEKEQEIRAAEERLMLNDVPRTADEFEKLVRGSPNSSFLWIKYMALMLSLADIEKARSIAERALRTINIREESEKLNIWMAYFNLENEYGNPPEEAVVKVFQRALQYCDPKKVHLALLGMYERTEQHKLADELLEKMTKKFKHSCKVWLRRVQNVLKQHQDGVQPVINRALLCLPRHKHIKFISQTAILEFKSGVPDRGRSMFEGMLREYPKRTDLWSVYLDQEIRLGDIDIIRALFERAINLSLEPRKMKFLFKKYLEYEKSQGDEERIESVKRKAMEYANSTLA